MNSFAPHYESFAKLLSYPQADYKEVLLNCRQAMRGAEFSPPESPSSINPASSVEDFFRQTKDLSLEELEELYTRTFDINPLTSLEIGWHLYGEAYERGAFLVRMRELLRSKGIKESSELPDHLTHVLRLIARLQREEAEQFVHAYVNPALKKMIEGFEKRPNPYEYVLRAVCAVLQETHLEGVEHHG